MKIDFSALNDTHITECAHLYCKVYKEAPPFEKSELAPVIAFIQQHLKNNYFRGYIARYDEKIVAVSIGFKKPWPGALSIISMNFSSIPIVKERVLVAR